MSNKLKKKTITIIIVEIICIVVLGIFLTNMQTNLSISNQKENTKEKLDMIQSTVESAIETSKEDETDYDELYQSKTDSIAFMAQKDQTFTYSDVQMKNLADMMNVSNVLIIDQDGNQIVKGTDSPADFTAERFNQLRLVFSKDTPGAAFSVTFGDQTYRYYAAKIDETHAAVIENDPQELTTMEDNIASWDSVLSKINVGLTGFTFAVSNQDYTFLYYPEDAMIGQDSLVAGLDVNELEDNNYAWMTIHDQRYYCGVKSVPDHNAYVICAVPESEITSSCMITVAIILFIFAMIMTLIVVYALLTMREQERKHETFAQEYADRGAVHYNREVVSKVGGLAFLGLILILIISFYMQTLFSLSRRSMSNNTQIADVEATIEENKQQAEEITTQYNRRYLNKCQVASYILSNNHQLWNKTDLAKLSDLMNIEYLMIYDQEGNEVISDSTYTNLQVSKDEKDPTSELYKLLLGEEYVILDAQDDELSGDYIQFIGVTLKNADGNIEGFVKIALVPDKQEKALKATSLSAVLKGVKASAGGFAFAVDKKELTFSWYPEDRMVGKSATEYGMTENAFIDQFCDFISINGESYYASSLETDNNYIYIATPKTRMNKTSLPVALASTGASLVCMLLIFGILIFARKPKAVETEESDIAAVSDDPDKKSKIVNVSMPDGTTKKTEAAAARWSDSTTHWTDKTPEQQMGTILKTMLTVFALAICICICFKDTLFGEDSIFLYVINGQWERNINIFSITACLMIICVVKVVVMILQQLLKLISKSVGARGTTVCRLLRNLLKYAGIIGLLYYCFALFGVDTATLLASAGILSLVIGLGAKELISDILAGLFIIFEGEFQVGDIVTVGDWRGNVQEIGIRTTKITDPGGNVKVISNSAISGVINMTKKNSFCVCDIGIEYGESLERVESILAKELPNFKKHVKTIKDGPFYKGVVSLGDNSVNLRIVAECVEADRVQLGRDLNRELKILFDKYDVNIPFPQVVINQPREYLQATDLDRLSAEEFNASQKELSKNLEEGQK